MGKCKKGGNAAKEWGLQELKKITLKSMEDQKRGKKLLFRSKWGREEGVSGSEDFYKVCYNKIESDKK